MPKKKSPNSVRIRNSATEFLTFTCQTGGDGVEVRDQTIKGPKRQQGQQTEVFDVPWGLFPTTENLGGATPCRQAGIPDAPLVLFSEH